MITLMNETIKQLALIGPTASGKTSLSIEIAQKMDACILSLDSLSIYKEIDIVSAKPSREERAGILHYGMDYLSPDEHFDVTTFVKLYQEVYRQALSENKNLVIVGGTSFYLKMLIEGISDLPAISETTKEKTALMLQELNDAYQFLYDMDPSYMQRIAKNDRYRIEKALHIYFETGMTPSEYFHVNPPTSVINGTLPIYQIDIDREMLRKRIALRTQLMLKEGLIDEICMLEKKYTREPNCMKSIGIKETLDYLDGVYNKQLLEEKITTNTARLAKRQTTFNNSQFEGVIKGNVEELQKIIVQ
ncbi:tRNA (adenosine(37)-N6)-dimethylallyltransferase MiaA [Sulfurovum sp. zt1-1]|uniref:tRNA dimethylallyltransferase n=1 Tax=Sulfurovum zhangzhouensis TaxID=3019067 RepID=A0ABT7QXC8_9BACT|nr:tRNA (adenosine(37)-N6)-dimethylallyltransferase MiaA [Sulfurovum zhangzhouensis]MDM5271482.1 tRNA (adenosine(37)-N6)-dimethylallyltransferase MiaA [Sulfurovum zhangzhouensis]